MFVVTLDVLDFIGIMVVVCLLVMVAFLAMLNRLL